MRVRVHDVGTPTLALTVRGRKRERERERKRERVVHCSLRGFQDNWEAVHDLK